MERCCLVVGADRLGPASKFEAMFEVEEVIHWNGRRRLPSALPSGVEVIVVFTEFVSHGSMQVTRRMARQRGVRMVFLKRGLSECVTGQSQSNRHGSVSN